MEVRYEKNNLKKSFYAILLISIIVILTSGIVYATTQENKKLHENIDENVKKQVINTDSIMEVEITSVNIKKPEINENSSKMLEKFEIDDSTLKETRLMYNKELDKQFTRATYEKYEIDIDNSGNIIAYKNFDDYSVIDKEKRDYIENVELEDKVFAVDEANDLNNIISMIESENNLEEYKLIDCSNSTEGAWTLTWCRDYGNDLINAYDCVNVVVDADDGSIWLFGKNENLPNRLEPVITQEEAINLAESIISDLGSDNKINVQLSFFKPNFYWGSSISGKENCVRLSWKIDIGEIATVYIDAETGKNIGGDSYQSTDCGRVLSVCNFIGSQDRVDRASEAFNRLEYDQSTYTPVNWSISQDDINWVLSRPDCYGLYLACHGGNYGNYNSLTDNSRWRILSSTNYGNWHFVYLDACYSSINNNWANSFGCNGYSGRCLVGWNNSVGQQVAYDFDMEFFPRLGSQTVYDAVVTSLWIRRNAGDNSR